uniref:Aquaporin n=1 Tax=Strongyloides venezuelensis TaxID=75913 RepID=A0A0K0F724_STRVS
MDPWVCSFFYYLFIFGLCHFSNTLLNNNYVRSKYYTKILHELVGTIQTCAPSFDVFFVLTHYGVFGFFLEITFLELLNSYISKEAFADPSALLIECYKNKKWFCILLVTQLVGGLISFQLARFWWSFNIHPTYLDMLMNINCHSHLNVSIVNGMLIESIGVIGIYYITELINKKIKNPMIVNIFSAISVASICVSGLNLTGMYANPIIAWSCTFNCQGLSHFGHFFVYWLGPILGNVIFNKILKNNTKQNYKNQASTTTLKKKVKKKLKNSW